MIRIQIRDLYCLLDLVLSKFGDFYEYFDHVFGSIIPASPDHPPCFRSVWIQQA